MSIRIARRGTMAGRGVVAMSSQTFSYTGASQDFVVPAGVTTLTVDLYGAQGGTSGAGHAGGLGGRVKCDVPVTPGETLHVHVGQKGLTGNPFGNVNGGWNGGGIGTNGGGSGGGATDIRRTPYANADRLSVAGAGGGTGGNGGAGVGTGGAGATPTGAAGGGGTFCGLAGGGGGTSSAGGAAGTCSCTAQAGSLGQGGNGCNFSGSYRGGAGGGGGRYGGGGAGSGSAGSTGGGGGGGSGLSTGTNETLTTGVRSGNGEAILSWPT